MSRVQSPRQTLTATIASGAASSSGLDLMGYRVASLQLSSGWDAANKMTFKGSQDGASFFGLYDEVGTEYAVASGAAVVGSATQHHIVPSPDLSLAISAHRYLKIQSGPTTAAVNLTTGVTIGLVLVPL